jgi:hypothetical protein
MGNKLLLIIKSKRVFLLVILTLLFQLLILTRKYAITISERKNVSWCEVECSNNNSTTIKSNDRLSNQLFKNSDLSALVYLSSQRQNFSLKAQDYYSIWSKNHFSRFLNLWGEASMVISSDAIPPSITLCHRRTDFPLFDLNRAVHDGLKIEFVSLYMLENYATNDFFVVHNLPSNQIEIIELPGQMIDSKCQI